jgi:uncharacterized membrane protein
MIVLAVALTGGLLAGAGAYVHGHGGRPELMRRVASAVIDDALDAARVTPEQRGAIHGVRDRVFAELAGMRQARERRLEQVLGLFEADVLDPAAVAAARAAAAADHQRMADVIAQAVTDVHAALTPEQRRALAEYVRAHHRHRRH